LLEFEHIIQVNDPTDDDIALISKDQLWEGLVFRARQPGKFNESLQCEIEDVDHNEFLRTISSGEAQFHERVLLYPDESIHTSTTEELEQINASSVTDIEEPESGYLFVRFSYRRDLDEDDDSTAELGEHLKSAYVQMDRDAISMIRMLVESGLFGQAIN
jgi:hypothetical protein